MIIWTKPFNTRELLARIKAILRRTVQQTAGSPKMLQRRGSLDRYYQA